MPKSLRITGLIIAAVVLTASLGWADALTDRILLPIATGQIPGAFGSLWTSEAVVHNDGPDFVDFDADEYCIAECPPSQALRPGETRHVLYRGEPASNPGFIMFVQHSDFMTFESRIQDISRQAQTWGTEIPVVREGEFTTQPVVLVNVPMDGRFRLMLRVYDIDGRADASVRVEVFPFPGSGAAIGQIDLPLIPPGGRHPKYKPSYVQYEDLHGLIPPGFNPGSVVGARITPLTPGLRIWAFISVTNNETQHVTTVTPQ